MGELRTKRAYESADKDDGTRILVDRLWPRGLKKDSAHLNDWRKDIAPSNELRKWFGHDPDKFEAFRVQYLQELDKNECSADFLKEVEVALKRANVTFVYAAKDKMHNHAIVLREWTKEHLNH